eukprot:3884034-Amphidinium_carterae.1
MTRANQPNCTAKLLTSQNERNFTASFTTPIIHLATGGGSSVECNQGLKGLSTCIRCMISSPESSASSLKWVGNPPVKTKKQESCCLTVKRKLLHQVPSVNIASQHPLSSN